MIVLRFKCIFCLKLMKPLEWMDSMIEHQSISPAEESQRVYRDYLRGKLEFFLYCLAV